VAAKSAVRLLPTQHVLQTRVTLQKTFHITPGKVMGPQQSKISRELENAAARQGAGYKVKMTAAASEQS